MTPIRIVKMFHPNIKLIQALSTNPNDVCFEALLKPERVTFNEIDCEYDTRTQEWKIASWYCDDYSRTPEQERKWVECFSRYLKQFEKDIV